MFVKVAVPRTYKFDPFGGLLMVPIDTPFPYATFAFMVVHWDDAMNPTFEAEVTRPYWSTVTCETFAEDPYIPAVTPLVGNTLVERVPRLTLLAFMFEIADPFDAVSNPWTTSPVSVPTDVIFG